MDDHDGADAIERAWQDGLKPDPLLTVSEWADCYRSALTAGVVRPGRWRTERTPYTEEIMDALSPSSPVQRVALMKGRADRRHRERQQLDRLRHPPRAGADAGGAAVRRAGQALLQQRIDPLIEESPVLREKVAPLSRQRQHGALRRSSPAASW